MFSLPMVKKKKPFKENGSFLRGVIVDAAKDAAEASDEWGSVRRW
jgi:hypothetical protein